MFTGIIEETGRIRKVIGHETSGFIEIQAHEVLTDTKVGDSIAVNGVCLTVTRLSGDAFVADVMPETLRKTNLGSLSIGDPVNLERAMAANGRFGGHIVSGHIDGTGQLLSLRPEGNAVWLSVSAEPSILRLIVEKGSIAIDGVSLSVAYVDHREFRVSIIPHTGAETTLLRRKPGAVLNLETDIVGKCVEKLLSWKGMDPIPKQSPGMTLDFLQENGF